MTHRTIDPFEASALQIMSRAYVSERKDGQPATASPWAGDDAKASAASGLFNALKKRAST